MELRQCEVDQANLHTKYMSSYMSDSFTARGGDHEAILVLLLIPRMLFKVSFRKAFFERLILHFTAKTSDFFKKFLVHGPHLLIHYLFYIG